MDFNGPYKWIADHFNAYASVYAEFDDFYKGRHPDVLSDATRNTFGRLFGGIKDNLCPSVVNTLADRLRLTGWTSDNDTAQEFLTNYFDQMRVPGKAMRISYKTVLYGDAYVIVWPNDKGIATIYVQDTPNMAVRYDADGSMTGAAKCWTENLPDGIHSRLRLTVYYADQTERYASSPGIVGAMPGLESLEPYSEDGGNPVIKNPYGRIPVFHFSNTLDPADCGQSELVDVISLQKQLNKAHIDLSIAEEFTGYKQRWATGIEIPINPETGLPVEPFKAAIDRLWISPSPESKFGEFMETDLSKLIEVINDKRQEIARVSRTPVHLMMLNTGQFPSGEALKTAEGPLLSKVDARQFLWGDVWEDVGSFICTISNIDPGEVNAVWAKTAPHSDLEQTEVGKNKKDLGVSTKQIRRELGYSDAEIEQMDKENNEESAAASARAEAAFNASTNQLNVG